MREKRTMILFGRMVRQSPGMWIPYWLTAPLRSEFLEQRVGNERENGCHERPEERVTHACGVGIDGVHLSSADAS